VTTYTTTRARFSDPSQITPGSIVRLGGDLCRVVTPRILECCHTGRWFFDARAFRGGEHAEPVRVEYVGGRWDPAVKALIEEESKCKD
jgi:hypothetical protein